MAELEEKDFIREPSPLQKFPFWLWFFLTVLFLSLLWGGASWYAPSLAFDRARSPFLQTTNREFSLFLWSHPEFMRRNQKDKIGYLPAFRALDNEKIDARLADAYASVPPEILFLYHVWHRLLGKQWIPRPIPREEFREFLANAEEWLPENWPQAPAAYKETVDALLSARFEDLSALSWQELPLQARQAFQGWKNYFKEGERINQIKPLKEEMEVFLRKYPFYARPYWRNILLQSYPQYLLDAKQEKEFPSSSLAPFLKVAFFNFQQGAKGE